MTSKSLKALVTLNVVLLIAVTVMAFSPPPANAQLSVSSTQYMMISGTVRGRSNQAGIYIIDRNSAKVMGIFFNSSTDKVQVIAPPHSIRQDVMALQRRNQ